MKLVIDLRWVRSEVLDGIARVSLSVTAELLKQHPDWTFILLFEQESQRQFCVKWMQQRGRWQANKISVLLGFDAQSPRNRLQLWPQIRSFEPDLFFSFYYLFHPVPIPAICMVHDLIPVRFPDYFALATTMFKMLMTRPQALRYILGYARQIVTVSEHSRQDLIHVLGIPERQISLCHPGVDPATPVRSELPPLDLPADYLLCVARPDPHKNFKGLIEAYAQLPTELKAKHALVLAGPSDERYSPGLERRVQELELADRVIFTGAIQSEDLSNLYAHARLFVFPSLYEGFGLPVLEAMVQGVPVITSNVSSMPEVAGEAAILIDPENSAELTAAMLRLLEDPEFSQELGNKGLHRAAQFSWQESARELSSILAAELKPDFLNATSVDF